jgi:hypothetical protein
MDEKRQLRLNLLENAYDYLNSAIEYGMRARKENSPLHWKFAILHITFCIELMLKERLRRAHALLIYANIDKYRPLTRETKTAPWIVLIERIKYVMGDRIEKIDAGRLDLAQRLRNQLLHYDVEFEFPNVYHDFANLVNFVREFQKEIRDSEDDTLHQHLAKRLLREDDDLFIAFEEEIVYFNSAFMSKDYRDRIIDEQNQTKLFVEGQEYLRIAFGAADEWMSIDRGYTINPCHDCGVIEGQIHILYCDMERCPRCGGQLVTCGCHYRYPEPAT